MSRQQQANRDFYEDYDSSMMLVTSKQVLSIKNGHNILKDLAGIF